MFSVAKCQEIHFMLNNLLLISSNLFGKVPIVPAERQLGQFRFAGSDHPSLQAAQRPATKNELLHGTHLGVPSLALLPTTDTAWVLFKIWAFKIRVRN